MLFGNPSILCGPVELDRGFILHTNDYENDKNHIKLDDGLILSSDFSTIKEVVLGNGLLNLF